ncbi:NAD-dependent deacylase [Paenactinomyces guangxiensis]|uniref:NAD-dependent protein deacetylase n=1 Tax=Paenactinomyces guangxiensis TaxID=1490290 RepID=A0A7W1WRG8_9BACL|nr:NAD-dependent deacylase [Paenactinomyces guangxiensis]MBA4494531.1 NAD-dependent deacylase [Paenactinomyces guangxiensis]MBH8591707.1 NAD-dependent deacylase [Paenactinomyces guangxiensis]
MIEDWLKESKYTVVFTGAGMSTESGLPDFRSSGGLWAGKDPMVIASTYALQNNRDEFTDFYRSRIKELLKHKPHEGHEILARWEKEGFVHGIITQNVDTYHQKAGSQHVAEIHGSLGTVHCSICGTSYPFESYLAPNGTQCTCGGFIRPSIVLFGESLPEEELTKAEEMISKAELCIVLGSSLQVSPANYFPITAKENGAKLAIINMEPTEFDDYADLVINGKKIGSFLKEVDEKLREDQ